MTLQPQIPRPLRALLLKFLAVSVGSGAAFAAVVWVLGRSNAPQVWFISSAVLVAMSSTFLFYTLGQLALAQSGNTMLRYAYALFGVVMPAVSVLALSGYGVVLSTAVQVLMLFVLPAASEESTSAA